MGFFLLFLDGNIKQEVKEVNINFFKILVVGGFLGSLTGLTLMLVYTSGRKKQFTQLNPAQRDLKKGYERTQFLKSV